MRRVIREGEEGTISEATSCHWRRYTHRLSDVKYRMSRNSMPRKRTKLSSAWGNCWRRSRSQRDLATAWTCFQRVKAGLRVNNAIAKCSRRIDEPIKIYREVLGRFELKFGHGMAAFVCELPRSSSGIKMFARRTNDAVISNMFAISKFLGSDLSSGKPDIDCKGWKC